MVLFFLSLVHLIFADSHLLVKFLVLLGGLFDLGFKLLVLVH